MATQRIDPTTGKYPERFFFGRSWKPGQHRPGWKGHDMSEGGLPVPWCDKYAARIVAAGYTVEKIRFVRRPHPRPDYASEMIVRREVVETVNGL